MSQIYQALKRAVIRQVPDETLTWNSVALSDSETTQDYDFISFTGTAAELLNDTTLRNFIEQGNGKIFKKAREAFCRSGKFKHVLHFGSIGDYMIGITLFSSQASQIGFATRSNKQYFRDFIERTNLSMYEFGNIPFRDISAFLLDKYNDVCLTIFRYGQKTSFVEADLTQNLRSINPNIHIDIAIALEVDQSGIFMLPNSFYFAGSEIYPFLGCTHAGPLFVKNPHDVFLDCYHICIYNTIQHVRKHTDYHISTSSQTFNLAESLQQSILRLTTDCMALYQELENHKKLRIEVYISFNHDTHLDFLLQQMKNLICTENVVMAASCSSVITQVQYQCTLLRNICENSPFKTFTDFFIICQLYTILIRNLFCTEKLTSSFQSGFYLSSHFFNCNQDVQFSADPVLKIPKYFSNHEELQLYTRIKQIESSLMVPMSDLTQLLHKVAFEVETFYEKFYQKHNNAIGDTVSIETFLSKQTQVTNAVHRAIAEGLLKFSGRDVFRALTKQIVKHGLSLKVHGRVYLYHGGSITSTQSSTEDVDHAAFRLQLQSFYESHQRAGVRQYIGSLDFPEEYLQRLLVTVVPERVLTLEYDSCPFVPLQTIFQNTNGFLRFAIYFFICVKLGDMNQMPKVMNNYRDSVRNHVVGRKYTASQLMLYTGCFIPEGHVKNTVVIQRVAPRRISRLILLAPSKFLKLLKATSEEPLNQEEDLLDHEMILRLIHQNQESQESSFHGSDDRRSSVQKMEFDDGTSFSDECSDLFNESRLIESDFDANHHTSELHADPAPVHSQQPDNEESNFMVLFTSELLKRHANKFSTLHLSVRDIREAGEDEISLMCAEATGLSKLLCKSVARELKAAANAFK